MPSYWREQLDPARHKDLMVARVGGFPRVPGRMVNGEARPADPLLPGWAYFVRVKGFTFEFPSVESIQEAIAFFSRPIHPSSLNIPSSYRHWSCRLPAGVTSGRRREVTLRTLKRAHQEFLHADITAKPSK